MFMLGVLLLTITSHAQNKTHLDAKQLYEGSWVPEKREYPLGQNPCEDFYKYTCGPLVDSFQLREDRSYHAFAFSDSRERMLQARKNYLQLLVQSDSPTKVDASAKSEKVEAGKIEGRFAGSMRSLFRSCMNPEARKKEELVKTQKEKTDILSAITSKKDLVQLMSARAFEPRYSPLGYSDIENQKNPTVKDLMFLVSLNFIAEKSYYEKPDFVADLKNLYVQFFKTMNEPNAESRADAVLALEKDFINNYPDRSTRRDRFSENNSVERKTFVQNYSELPMTEILKKFPKNVALRNPLPEGLKNLNRYIAENKLDVLKDLIFIRSAMGQMDDAYPEFFKLVFDFKHKHLGGPEKRPDRLERCTKLVENQFGKEIDYELLPILFKDFPEERIKKLSERIRESILEQLKENKWLTAAARKEAIQKTKTAELMVFKPQNDKEWDFAPVAELKDDQPLTNIDNLAKARIIKELKEFGEARFRRKWYMGPLEINAYYNPTDNQFVLPAGILQYPFFDKSMSDEQILGGIGSVIGHELGHGIDDQGSKYDHKGRLQAWMSSQDLEQFRGRTKGFVTRFSAIKHDGKLTLGENIGDSVGIRSSFRAAFGKSEAKWDSEKLKSFFIQYGRNWCYKARPSLMEMMLKTDPHSSGEARVNEQVIHLQGFYKAFQCTAKDKMYLPEGDRIQVW